MVLLVGSPSDSGHPTAGKTLAYSAPHARRRQPVCVVVGQAGTAPICRTPCGITLCIPKAACGWIGRGRPAGNLPLRAAVWISGLAFVTQPQRLDHGTGGGQKLPAKRARQEPVISLTACREARWGMGCLTIHGRQTVVRATILPTYLGFLLPDCPLVEKVLRPAGAVGPSSEQAGNDTVFDPVPSPSKPR